MTALLVAALLLGADPASDPRVEDNTKAIAANQDTLARILEMLERVEKRLDDASIGREQIPQRAKTGNPELDGIPDWEIMQENKGRWVVHPQVQVPVFAKSEWIETYHGKVRVLECVRAYGRPVPVGAVTYGASKAKSGSRQGGNNGQTQRPANLFNFGGETR